MTLKTKLLDYRELNGLVTEIICSEEESAEYKKLVQSGKELPSGVYRKVENNNEYFYTIADNSSELTREETLELIALMQLEKLNTIKNCCVFFTILAILGIIIGIITSMCAGSALGL